MKKILIIGGYDTVNFGDDFLLKQVIKYCDIRFSDADVTVYSNELSFHSKFYPNVSFVKEEVNIHDFDMFIWGGGTQFYVHSNNYIREILRYLKYKLGFNNSIHNKVKKLLKRDSGKKSIMLGVGIGPFKNNSPFQFFWRDLFKEIDEIYVRDNLSYNILNNWSIPSKIIPDLVFINDYSDLKSIKPKYDICLIIRGWDYGNSNSFILNINRIFNELKENYSIKVILFSKVKDSDLIDNLNQEKIDYLVWNPDYMSFKDLLLEMSRCNIIVSSRFHGIVVSTILEKPSISLNLDHKLTTIHYELGLKDLVLNKSFSKNELEYCIKNISRNREHIQDKLSNYSRYNREFLLNNIYKIN